MLDMTLVRNDPDKIRTMLKKRNLRYPLDILLRYDKDRRHLISKIQKLKHSRNIESAKIAEMKKLGFDIESKIHKMKNISHRIELGEAKIRKLRIQSDDLVNELPNIPHESVPEGIGATDNVEIRRWGKPQKFAFKPRNHIDLAIHHDLIDLERASKVAGSRFYYLKGELVRLNYSLIKFALDFLVERDWILIQPPYLLNKEAIRGSIIMSDFEEVIYKIENEDLYMIGTSEHALAAMHMNEVIGGEILPLHYAGVSPCFRKEAGAHGRDTKGIFRVHQFEKVEQFVFSRPEDSWNEFESMIKNAEEFFKALEIPYRIVTLCGGELSKVSAKTYDLEAFFPSQNQYREVVSCSNCTDYQARRLLVKYREKSHEPSKFVHTLNSTLVATERTLIALMENHQTQNGSIVIPKALRRYVGGRDIIMDSS